MTEQTTEQLDEQTEATPKKRSPKQPQDRQPKAEDGPKVLKVEVRGEEFTVEADALDDFELLDDLGRLDDGDPSRLPSVLRRMLGTDDYRRALKALRGEDGGRISIEDGAEFVRELMEGLDPSS